MPQAFRWSCWAAFISRWRDLGQARTSFLATDIEPPLGWTEGEVEARIERLDLELESATRHEISQARAADVREQLNTQRANLDQAREKLRSFAADIGVSAETRLETGFQLWCRHLHDWQGQGNWRSAAPVSNSINSNHGTGSINSRPPNCWHDTAWPATNPAAAVSCLD